MRVVNMQTSHCRVGTLAADPELWEPYCMTCGERNLVPRACTTILPPRFSRCTEYYIMDCLGPDVPSVHLFWTYEDKCQVLN